MPQQHVCRSDRLIVVPFSAMGPVRNLPVLAGKGEVDRKMILSRVFHVFTRAPGAHPVLTALCLFAAGVFDVIGMSLVIPLLNSLASHNAPSASPLSRIAQSVMQSLGLGSEPGSILPFLAGALTVKSLLILAAMAYVSYSVAEVGLRLRRRLLDALLQANLTYFTSQTPARISNALVNDVNAAATAFNQASVAVAELLKLSAILIAAFLVAGWAVLAILAVVGAAALILSQSVKYRRSVFRRQKQVSDELIGRASDTFHNIKVLKGMSRLGPLRDVIGGGIADVRDTVFQSQMTRHLLNAFQDILLVLALCGGLYVGMTWLAISMPELIVLATLFLLIGTSIRSLLNILHDFRESLPAFEACETLLQEASASAEQMTGRRAPQFNADVVFRNVSFAHRDKSILSNVSFNIPPGRITVLEGTSGAGKTTTVDLLAGLHRPLGGSIEVGGVPLADIAIETWRAGIGYVPQELTLIGGTVLENIALGDPRITREDALHALEIAGASAFIKALPKGIDTDVGTSGTRFSGGERQRISLARALAGKPHLLILDEVTSALDEATEREICKTIAGLCPPLTIVAITHRPAWTAIASQVFRLRDQHVIPSTAGTTQPPSVLAGAQ